MDALGYENVAYRGGNVRIFSVDQAGRYLDDSNLTAEASVHLAEPICGDDDAAAVGQVVIVAILAAINGSAVPGFLRPPGCCREGAPVLPGPTTTALSAI